MYSFKIDLIKKEISLYDQQLIELEIIVNHFDDLLDLDDQIVVQYIHLEYISAWKSS